MEMNFLKPIIAMILVQVSSAIMNILIKLAVFHGMDRSVFVAYRFLFGTAVMVPFALIVERNKRPKLTWMILLQSFFTGLFGGSLSQTLFTQSLSFTSVTMTSAIFNLVPATTFIFALIFRLEKLALRTLGGKAKVLGTLIGIGGAILLTLYKGVDLQMRSTHFHLSSQNGHVATSHDNPILGALLALGSCCSYALWLIIQKKTSESYPCVYSNIALMCVMGSIQSTAFGIYMERDWNQWKLGWNIRLVAVSFAGIIVSGVMAALMSWCVRKKGSLFVSIFSPLMLILVALADFSILGEKLYLGSILGAILIILGLYTVLWGTKTEIDLLVSSKSNETIYPIDESIVDINDMVRSESCNYEKK